MEAKERMEKILALQSSLFDMAQAMRDSSKELNDLACTLPPSFVHGSRVYSVDRVDLADRFLLQKRQMFFVTHLVIYKELS